MPTQSNTLAGDDESESVLLLMSPATYRAAAFVSAAEALGVRPVTVVDMPDRLSEYWGQARGVSFADITDSVDRVARIARDEDVAAVLSVDDSATELAARVNRALSLPHNAPEAAEAARDKLVMRRALTAGGVRCPWFRAYPATTPATRIASEAPFPCVVKPLRLSGSRGVIRANDSAELDVALRRLTAILAEDGNDLAVSQVLVEEYMPGGEVAVEGLLTDGDLHVLAIFDKPDPLEGPFFEETIYVTPSRLPKEVQQAIEREAAAAAAALGLVHGPIHAELRVNERGPWILEIAGRSIGGLCSTVLSFGTGMCLEELILRHAVGREIPSFERTAGAAGVMMIPIPRAGILRAVEGTDEAAAVVGVTGVEITARLHYPIAPLPEGASYLGFIFARGATPGEAEAALREAHARLRIRIDPMLTLGTARAGGE